MNQIPILFYSHTVKGYSEKRKVAVGSTNHNSRRHTLEWETAARVRSGVLALGISESGTEQ